MSAAAEAICPKVAQDSLFLSLHLPLYTKLRSEGLRTLLVSVADTGRSRMDLLQLL